MLILFAFLWYIIFFEIYILSSRRRENYQQTDHNNKINRLKKLRNFKREFKGDWKARNMIGISFPFQLCKSETNER